MFNAYRLPREESRGSAQGEFSQAILRVTTVKGVSAMTSSPEAGLNRIVQRLRRWWRPQDAEEQYLAAAIDLADLERRIRVLERGKARPVFVTFNH
jgi:hypothetical protein